MKKIRITAGTIVRAMLAGALTLLGFSSCGDDELMYGTPTSYYEIKGTVKTEAGNRVEGAQVIMRTLDGKNAHTYPQDIVTTDSKGEYLLKTSGWPNPNIRIVCRPQDNTLEADSVDMSVSFKDADGIWDRGTARETVDFTLKFKKEINDH